MIHLPRPDFSNFKNFNVSIDDTPKVYQHGLAEANFEDNDFLNDKHVKPDLHRLGKTNET